MTVSMENATADSMLGLVRRLATPFNQSAIDPSSSSRGHKRVDGVHVARLAADGRSGGQSAQPKHVRFVQDITGEGPTEIPLAYWLFEEDGVPVRAMSPKRIRRGRWMGWRRLLW